MGMKKGVNALTKTIRIGAILIAVLLGFSEFDFSRFAHSASMLFNAAIIAACAWVLAWIMDSFVD